jgi:hypothetical protein
MMEKGREREAIRTDEFEKDSILDGCGMEEYLQGKPAKDNQPVKDLSPASTQN